VNEIVQIYNAQVEVKEYKNQRVVTLSDIDLVHQRPEGTARRNFNTNKNHFIEGEDYFIVGADEIRTSHLFTISPNDFTNKALITEQGYLMLVKSFTDDLAWDVQRQLVNGYFKVRQLATDLSPQMQMLYGMLDQMAQTERQAKEAKEIAQKAIDTTENIKEAVKPVFDDWSAKIKGKIAHVQNASEKGFNVLYGELYKNLEERAGCDLNTRLRNRKLRMQNEGCTKTEINTVSKLTIIEEDKRLKEIFSKIVSEYEIRYCA
jgi:hypothetical protein